MFNFPSEVQRLIYSYDYTYHDKYNKVLKHLKYISLCLKNTINYGLWIGSVDIRWGKNTRKIVFLKMINEIKKESKKLYPPLGSKFWGGLSDSDSDSD